LFKRSYQKCKTQVSGVLNVAAWRSTRKQGQLHRKSIRGEVGWREKGRGIQNENKEALLKAINLRTAKGNKAWPRKSISVIPQMPISLVVGVKERGKGRDVYSKQEVP